jgi:hypothetical protein
MQGGGFDLKPGGSRCLVLCERDCAACTEVTRATKWTAPLVKRFKVSARWSAKRNSLKTSVEDGRKGPLGKEAAFDARSCDGA